jgi:ribosome-binding ATPase YchF (GTP1/OBG family)
MKIGIVGYQGAGKSTLFEWLSGVPVDAAQAHHGQVAMATVPDARIDPMCGIYHPKKITRAALELADTPGLSRTHEGNAARLATIREAGCLVVVVAGFDRSDPLADLTRLADDLLLADLAIVAGRVEKLRESVKKPRPTRDQEMAELAELEPLVSQMEQGIPLVEDQLSEQQLRVTRSFGLLTPKPRLIVINVADDDERPEEWVERLAAEAPGGPRCVAIPVGLQLELVRMDPQDRQEMIDEMGLTLLDVGELLRTIMEVSGQMLFFTAGDKEVRSWMIRRGATALDAAAGIHTDLARGFIRAEVMPVADLIRLGSEREMKAHHLVRQEPKDYTIQEGDVLLIKFNV